MNYYKTLENFPKFTNCPMPDDVLIDEDEYKKLCAEHTAEANQKQAEIEAEAKPRMDRERLIRERMKEIAERELIEEGKIEKE